MANSTPRRRAGKAAPPPAAAPAAPDPAPAPPAEPAVAATPKRRSGWRIAAMVVGAVVILAIVFGGGLAAGVGLGRSSFGLARLRIAGLNDDRYAFPRQGHGWIMPYDDDGMMPFGPHHPFPGDGTMPRGGYGTLPQGAAYLGVTYEAVGADQARKEGLPAGQGALISTVLEGSPAAQAGLQTGDIILSVDGQKLADAAMLRYLVLAHAPGDEATLVILRNGNEQTIVVTLGQAPDTATP